MSKLLQHYWNLLSENRDYIEERQLGIIDSLLESLEYLNLSHDYLVAASNDAIIFEKIKETRIKDLEDTIAEVMEQIEYAIDQAVEEIEEEANYSWYDDHKLTLSDVI